MGRQRCTEHLRIQGNRRVRIGALTSFNCMRSPLEPIYLSELRSAYVNIYTDTFLIIDNSNTIIAYSDSYSYTRVILTYYA